MNSEIALQIAIEDARERHRQLLELIMTADRQAMTLLGVYITICTASIAGAATILHSGSGPDFAAWFLVGVTGSLFVGSYLCFLAMTSASISAPGREPEFWLWAIQNDGVSLQYAVESYLEQMKASQAKNRLVNETAALCLARAKLLGLSSPAVGLLLCVFIVANGGKMA